MTSFTIEAGARPWQFVTEAAPRDAERFQGLVSLQLRDELTGLPPQAPVQVSPALPGATPRAGTGGRVGLAGRPSALFADPWPAPAPRARLTARADFYLPLDVDADLGPQPGMPDAFAPRDLGTVDLRRWPSSIAGRLISRSTGPVAAATVRVGTMWPSFASIVGAGQAPNALSLWAGLYADRPVGTAVRRRTLSLLAGPKSLVRPVGAGSLVIRLSDRAGLVLGRPLAIEPGDPERQEFIVATAVDPGSSADQPAEVTLAYPLRRWHPAGAQVLRTSLAVAGADNATVREARAGDLSIFLDGLAGIAPANLTVEIESGGMTPEYHGFALWRATTAADGTFRLPPIHRVAHVELVGPPAADPVRVTLSAPGDTRADILFD